MSVALIRHPDCERHDPGEGHPESPRRLAAIRDHLISLRVMDLLREYEAPEVTPEALLRVHSADYLAQLEALAPAAGIVAVDADTRMTPDTLPAARRAAGAGVLAVDLIMKGEVNRAFCAVRPPGHHAERGKAMGFCFYNNIAVAVAHALAVHGLKRVAVVDFDVHYGNGTEDAFFDEPRVTVLSSFQDHLFPDNPVRDLPGRFFNLPLAPGTTGREMRQHYHDQLLPALDAARPQLLFVSAGFDAHYADPLAQLRFKEEDYAWLTEQIATIANRHAKGRVLSMLEGGYDPGALGRSVAAHVRALLET